MKILYDYEDMCDFVSSEGGDILQSDSSYNIDKEKLLNFVKGIPAKIQTNFRIESKANMADFKIKHSIKCIESS